tara:strand:+ start:1551 stop:1724 length:174 start_codon:yes stop_codon:yes gene_type:complete
MSLQSLTQAYLPATKITTKINLLLKKGIDLLVVYKQYLKRPHRFLKPVRSLNNIYNL